LLFSWYARNRHFKQKSNWSGQIFPILLICLAALLVAVTVTIRRGENAKAKTLASNAADAGSLAAASCWAGAFNRLIYRNWDKDSAEALLGWGHTGNYMGYATGAFNTYYYYKAMNFYYTKMRDFYNQVYTEAKNYLTDKYEDNASYYCTQAIDLLTQARDAVENQPIVSCASASWSDPNKTTSRFSDAANNALESARCIGAFYVCTAYMGEGDPPGLKNGITSWFKAYQLQNLHDAFDFMDEQYKRAIQTGQYYALSNSGYTSNLTNAQQDAFDFWLGGKEKGVFPGTGDSLSFTPTGGGCSITATVKLPKIKEYEIKMAQWNYPTKYVFNEVTNDCVPIPKPGNPHNDGIANPGKWNEDGSEDLFTVDSSKQLSADMRDVADYIETTLPTFGLAVETAAGDMVDCCQCVCGGSGGSCGVGCHCHPPAICLVPPCPNVCDDHDGYQCDPQIAYNAAVAARQTYIDKIQCVINWLTSIRDSSGHNLAIPALYSYHSDIFNNLWPEPTGDGKLQNISTYEEAANYSEEYFFDEHGLHPLHPGMMVININNVTLDTLDDESWETSCKVVSSCGGTSFSKARFDGYNDAGKGELVGTFNDTYYPEITGTQE